MGHIRFLLFLALALGLALALVACTATASATMSATPSASMSSGSPRLVCQAREPPLGACCVEGRALNCTVTGATAKETSFSLSAQLVGTDGATQTSEAVCQGLLQRGAGTCQGTVIALEKFWGGSFTIRGTVQPSGRALAPVAPTPTALKG